jgi:predicted RNA-binding protein (virulence factor B family)|tara:strand:+ start:2842 stop:3678 length:837 start_codon:yes stop_codon:yes gene_type:complete
MILGDYNDLPILRFTSVGVYLGDEDGDVLLPQKLVKDDWEEGTIVSVFLYRDSEDRLIATTLHPKVTVDRYGYLKVNQVNSFGAFLDWGIEKDLMVPYSEQRYKLVEGEEVLVYLFRDDLTDRLVATTKFKKFLSTDTSIVQLNQPVDIIIDDETDLGVKVIVDDQFSGLIYHQDFNKRLLKGEITTGYVYNIREDGKLDVRLEAEGYGKIEPLSEELFDIIQRRGGVLHLHDKSSPDEIKRQVGMSKKNFKKALGNLYKQKWVSIEEDSVKSLKPQS